MVIPFGSVELTDEVKRMEQAESASELNAAPEGQLPKGSTPVAEAVENGTDPLAV
jgi:hypothetical protein